MMKRVNIGNWGIDVDYGKTLQFNQNELEVCHCLYCENFSEAVLQGAGGLAQELKGLGINAAKPNHVSFFPTEEEDRLLYIGNYHFSGRMAEGEWSTLSNWDETNTFEIDDVRIGFSKEFELVPDGFPEPIIQINFEAVLHWVLDEKPEEI